MQLDMELPIQKPQMSGLCEKTVRPLTMMADLGLPKEVICAMLTTVCRLHPEHHRFLLGPVIQHRSDWMADTPPWLYRAVFAERLGLVLDEHREGVMGWHVGPAEITAVMFPATMESPLPFEYTQIYLWAAAQATAKHNKRSVEAIWKQTGGEPVRDDQVTAPGGSYHQHYRELTADIRRRVIAAQRARERPHRVKAPPKQTEPVPDRQASLLPLFDDTNLQRKD